MYLHYSKALCQFLQTTKALAYAILREETPLSIHRNSIRFRSHTYSLSFVTFQCPKKLGFFDPDLFEIGVNKIFLFDVPELSLKNLLRHELAHFLTHIMYGPTCAAHGKEFRRICEQHGWPKEVSRAKITMPKMHVKTAEIHRKVEKLLALSSSNNINEATEATLKAQALLNKYPHAMAEKEDMLVVRVFKALRKTPKWRAIAGILDTFGVRTVYNRGHQFSYYEIFGMRHHVIIAEYVAHFLNHKLDQLWEKARNEHRLKGLRSKNAFFLGCFEGFCGKLKKTSASASALICKNAIEKNIAMAYPRLQSCYVNTKGCAAGRLAGQRSGRQLKIDRGISPKNLPKLERL